MAHYPDKFAGLGTLLLLFAGFLTLAACSGQQENNVTADTEEHQEQELSDSLQVVYNWVDQAIKYRGQGEYQEALSLLGKALDYGRRNEDWQAHYWGCSQTGHTYRLMEETEKAVRHFEECIEISDPEKNRREIAVSLTNVAIVLSRAGEFQRALDNLEQSLEMRYQIDDNYGLAVTYNAIGLNYFRLLRLSEAETYYLRAMELADRYDLPQLNFRFSIASNIARLQLYRGNNDAALHYYKVAHELVIDEEMPQQHIHSYNDLAVTYRALNDPEKARKYYQKALDTAEKHGITPSRLVMANLVRLYEREQNHEQSDILLSQIETIVYSDENPRAMMQYYELRGDIKMGRNAHPEALSAYHEANKWQQRFPVALPKPGLLWKTAFAENRLGNMTEADQLFAEAISKTETFRRKIGLTGEARAGFFDDFYGYYLTYAGILSERDNHYEVLDIMESSRARSFADDINLSHSTLMELLPPDYAKEYDRIRSKMITIENQIINGDGDLRDLEHQWQELSLSAHGVLLSSLDDGNRDLQLYDPEIVRSELLQDYLANGTAVISFGVAEDYSLMAVADNKKVYSKKLPFGASDLDVYVREIREAIMREKPMNQVMELLDNFSEKLLADFDPDGLDRLIFITDGPLAYLPMELLRRNGRYLFEDLVIEYTPSLTAHQLLARRDRADSDRMLAFTNPEFDGAPAGSAIYRDRLRRLPFSELEGRYITEEFKGRTIVRNGKEASERYLKQSRLDRYEILHFATHGLLDNINPRYSGLVLATPSRPDDIDDGFLRTSEIYNLDLKADLVVLSACNSGMGRLLTGEGVLGLQRAFLYAGARNVVVTLWSVHDRSTSVFMRSFYRNMRNADADNGMDYAAMLRKARLEMMEDHRFSHPVHWAGFIITGSGVGIEWDEGGYRL